MISSIELFDNWRRLCYRVSEANLSFCEPNWRSLSIPLIKAVALNLESFFVVSRNSSNLIMADVEGLDEDLFADLYVSPLALNLSLLVNDKS